MSLDYRRVVANEGADVIIFLPSLPKRTEDKLIFQEFGHWDRNIVGPALLAPEVGTFLLRFVLVSQSADFIDVTLPSDHSPPSSPGRKAHRNGLLPGGWEWLRQPAIRGLARI